MKVETHEDEQPPQIYLVFSEEYPVFDYVFSRKNIITYPFSYLSIRLPIYLSIICMFIYLFMYLYTKHLYLSIRSSVYTLISLSVCLPIFLSI